MAILAALPVDMEERLNKGTVLIAGGGPVGLVLATTLASYGVRSVVLERNETTTRWPKMDLTNARSMEIFRTLGLADQLRQQGVPSHVPYIVRFSTGLNEAENITAWYHDSVDKYRQRIANNNNGTLPLEPYQRLSQAVFEAWLKVICDKNPLIDLRFGCKVETIKETVAETSVMVLNQKTGRRQKIVAEFVGACDGASSKIRTGLGIPLDGNPVPFYSLLVHFKSRDLSRLHRQGQFWHIFFLGEGLFRGAIIAQDEKDTWTTHLNLPLGIDSSTITSHEAVYRVLGGIGALYEIKIDEILVRSTYRPSIAVARKYISPKGTVLLAGDSAHQNIPTGGYGMNMGLGDAFDLGWKLATVIKGHGGSTLLQSYEQDRRPVAMETIERSGVHAATHAVGAKILDIAYSELNEEAGIQAQQKLREHYRVNDGENTDLGIEMGYRYRSSVCVPDPAMEEPEWTPSKYIPSTFPGSRAPHVFLKDGSAIFDYFGKYFSLVDFSHPSKIDDSAQILLECAKQRSVPLKHITLSEEDHACKIWGDIPFIIVRPDCHVAWRGHKVGSKAAALKIIDTVAGLLEVHQNSDQLQDVLPSKAFSGTGSISLEVQELEYKLKHMGDFQK